MLQTLKKVLSFRYDDRPMTDRVYESHGRWIRFFNDYYHRVEHLGCVEEALETARKEHVIFIMNHAILLEAALLNYFLLIKDAGKVSTLIYREAFKVPLFREFFRSCQCLPISVESGAKALNKRHILLFPEGMDFINGFINPDRIPAFHKGFLRMAKQYLKESKKKSVTIIPIGHAGLEGALRLWIIKNKTVMDLLIKPFINYPYLAFPKLPFLLPTKVVFHWGMPIRLTPADLRTEKKISKRMNDVRASFIAQRVRAQQERDTARI